MNKIVLFSRDNFVPTYPIFVSMLLWLSEQKENMVSFSNAILIENFVEKLLEKHSSQQYIYNDFDFNNKKKLLIEIAEYIHANNEKDIPYNEFYRLILKHLEERNFPFKVDRIADDLVSSGILINKNNNIGFRYYCVYSYFISLKLSYDQVYLDNILCGDGIFFYLNEIDILTTLNRDRIDIIDKVKERLTNMLKEVKDSIGIDLSKVDLFFKREFMLSPLISERLMSPEAKAIKEEAELKKVNELLAVSEENNNKKLNDRFEKISKLAEFERMWVLTARVLRNLDDYKDNREKILIMDNILNSAIYFVFLFNYSFFSKYIIDGKENIEKDIVKIMTIHFLYSPYLIEIFLQLNIGNIKLQNIFKEYMEFYLSNENCEKSNIKSYIINFLLIDNNCYDASVLKKYVKDIQESFIIDNVFIKLSELYHSSTSSDNLYFELLQILINKSKNWKEKQEANKELTEMKKQKQFQIIKENTI